MNLMQALQQLQAVDHEWDEKAKAYQVVKQRLGDESQLRNIREAQEARRRDLRTRNAALRDAELEFASVQEKAKKVEQDLYGGHIRAPRELEALRQDSTYLGSRISVLEDRVLEAMAEFDELESAEQQGDAELLRFEETWTAERQSLREQYQSLRERLQELLGRREQLRRQVAPAALALYDELRNTKRGKALSPARGVVCQTCYVTIPAHKVRLMIVGESTVACEGCGRILFPA